MKNYELDTTLLHEVWVTWMSKDGRIWMGKDGVRQKHAEWWMKYDSESDINPYGRVSGDGRIRFGMNYVNRNNDRIWVNAGSRFHYAYAKYHADIDRLELAAVRYDTTRGEGNHAWLYAGDRLFIGKDKSVIDQYGMYVYEGFNIKNDTVQSIKDAISMILHGTHNDKFLDEFKKFIGHNYYIIGNGTCVNIEYGWHLQKWYDSKQKTRSTGKSQKLVDELVKMPLGEIDHLMYEYAPKYTERYYRTVRNFVYFERVNDEWSVLRALVREDDGRLEEVWRVYLGEDGTNRFVTKSNGDWIPSSQHKGWYFNRSYYFANEKEAIEKCNRIRYIAPMWSSADGIDMLLTTLRFPCIEQLYKMGQTKMAIGIAHSSQPKAHIKNVFGGYYNEKEKNILRQIGMTKYQLDAYCKMRDRERFHYGSVLQRMREALGNDLSRVDNATFDKYLGAFHSLFTNFYGGRYVDMLDIDKGKFWKNLIRLNDKHPNVTHTIGDVLSMYNRLYGNRPEVDWLFDDYSDVVRIHDALVELINVQEAEERAMRSMSEAERHRKDEEKRKKTDENRKHYEYEDENFIIRLPKDVNEIVTEGSKQSICIGGYTTRHSKGETNLFFLRRKSDEGTPFYAIEMHNNKQIVQIHGSCNKWLGNNPEAIPTVVRWLRKHNIKCDPKILTCTSKGYSRRNTYIAMPKVD